MPPTLRIRRPMAWWTAVLVAGLYAAYLWIPWQPVPFTGDLDASWNVALHVAFTRGLAFGEDVIFTFGPLGFLYTPVCHPATHTLAVALRAFLGLALFVGLVALARRAFASWWGALLWLAAAIVLTGRSTDTFFGTLPLLVLIAHFHPIARGAGALEALLMVALAVAALVKFSCLLAAAAAVAVVAADDLLCARRLPLSPAIFLAALAAVWAAAGQRLAAFPGYVASSLEVARGYTAAMSLPAPAATIACAVGTTAVVLAFVVAGERRHRAGRAALATVGIAVQVFLVFKAGYVRYLWGDGHPLITASSLLMTALLSLAVQRAEGMGPGARALAAAACASAAALTWSVAGPSPAALPLWMRDSIVDVPESVRTVVHDVEDPGALAARCARVRADIRRDHPLAPVTGTVDVYPWALGVPIAHGLRYQPRPVLQSYVAYTPGLAEANARHLRGPTAPDTILFDVRTIDWRLPSLDDGRSWPELLTRYRIADAGGEFLRLERSRAPGTFALSPLAELARRHGTAIRVPPGSDPVWAVIDVPLRPLGRVAEALLSIPPPSIMLTTADGAPHGFRLVPGMAAAGFLLSPLVEDRLGFALVAGGRTRPDAAGHPYPPPVVSFTITIPPEATRLYRKHAHVAFFQLRFPPQDLAAVPGLDALAASLAPATASSPSR